MIYIKPYKEETDIKDDGDEEDFHYFPDFSKYSRNARCVMLLEKGKISQGRGRWELANLPSGAVPMISCPKCGKLGVLHDHSVEPDGSVHPSVVCPGDCGFHSFVRLKEWEEPK